MQNRIFIPDDTTAVSLDANNIAAKIHETVQESKSNFNVVRNGSRGLFWLEPLIEVEWEGERHAFGPIEKQDVQSLITADQKPNIQHPKYLGLAGEIPELKMQSRFTFDKMGVIESLNFEDYIAHGGLKGLKKVLGMTPENIAEEVLASGLRGRGGAGFPTGIKMKTVLGAKSDKKYVVCNADEGDSGTFADRLILEGDPFMLIEGMVIAAIGVGAEKGYIYLRSEYPLAHQKILKAIHIAERKNLLGKNILQSEKSFSIEVRLGAGAYICGEETSLLESIEGKPGLVRAKPPLPALQGLFGKPTLINNLLTLATLPKIFECGSDVYASMGTDKSSGTICLQLAGNVRRGGLFEFPFGVSLRKIIEDVGGGTYTGKAIKCAQVGGPLGTFIPKHLMDVSLDYDTFAKQGDMIGHGGVVVFDESANMARMAYESMTFCALHSCGKCTPCRIGSVRGAEVIEKMIQKHNYIFNKELLIDLCKTMKEGSLCAMGGLIPLPVESALTHFESDFMKSPDNSTPIHS